MANKKRRYTTALGSYLSRREGELGLSGQEAAAGAGITPGGYSKLKSGRVNKPRRRAVEGLARVMNCNVAFIQNLVAGSFAPFLTGRSAEDATAIQKLTDINDELETIQKALSLLRLLLEKRQKGYAISLTRGSEVVELELL